MKPAATIRPVASTVSLASSVTSPTATTRPSLTPTSPWNRGFPLPSTIVPPVIFRSSMSSPLLFTAILHRIRQARHPSDVGGVVEPERLHLARLAGVIIGGRAVHHRAIVPQQEIARRPAVRIDIL